MRTEKKTQPDFSNGTGSEIPIPIPRTKVQTLSSQPDDPPKPKVPPRMKKKGPALPEKPPHLRNSLNSLTTAPTLTVVSPSQQAINNNKDLNAVKQQSNSITIQNAIQPKSSLIIKQLYDDHQLANSSQREVLVAASKTARDRPIERRQREPAKFLTAPTVPKKIEDSEEEGDTEPITVRTKQRNLSKPIEFTNHKKSEKSKGAAIFNFRKNRTPMVLIPRGHPLLDSRNLTHMWGGVYPTAYAMWLQNYENGDSGSGLLRPIFGSSVDLRPYGVAAAGHSRGQQRSRADAMASRSGVKSPKTSKHSSSTSVASSAKPRSSSVTRSGSLTSHGSTSSDSGNETFPKSVLKKQKRNSNKTADRPEQKKNVTFNAFATVQLMEE